MLRPLYTQPDVVVIHRDEESNQATMIRYRHINRIRKYDGVDLKESRSAVFNGANIVVVNVVKPDDPWGGITTDEDMTAITAKFLKRSRSLVF